MSIQAEDLGLNPLNSLFGMEEDEKNTERVELPIKEMHGFRSHPFRVNIQELGSLIESIKEHGVLSPVIVRKDKNASGYEIISGHRRQMAASMAGLETVPAIILECDDDEAAVYMVDSNIYREKLLPSEKAFAYKMKSDAMKHQGKKGEWTSQKLAEDAPDSARTIHRYISLTKLVKGLLDMVDADQIGVSIGAELSALDSGQQEELLLYMEMHKKKPSFEQAQQIKQAAKDGSLDDIFLDQIFGLRSDPAVENQPKHKGVSFKRKQLSTWFPDDMSDDEITDIIVRLLEEKYGSQS